MWEPGGGIIPFTVASAWPVNAPTLCTSTVRARPPIRCRRAIWSTSVRVGVHRDGCSKEEMMGGLGLVRAQQAVACETRRDQ